MTPTQARSSLDRMLRHDGESCRLQRTSGGVTRSVDLRAQVRDYKPEQLSADNGLQAGDSHVILSTTEINAAQWPDAATLASATTTDPRVPIHSDRLVMQSGRVRTVLRAWPAPYIGGELVRIEMDIR